MNKDEKTAGYGSRFLDLSSERHLYESIFEKNASPRDSEVMNWRFGGNLQELDKSAACLVYPENDPNEAAALYATIASPVKIGEKTGVAVQSLDTLTAKDHRRRGLFERSALDTYAHLGQQCVSFVYGFPNSASNPGFVKKLGWVNMDPVPFLIRPFPTNIIRSRLGRSASADPNTPAKSIPASKYSFGHEYEVLWQDFREQMGVGIDRHSAYMSWRLSKPGSDYRIMEERTGDKLSAIVAFCITQKHGRRMGYVMECIHARESVSAAARCMSAALREMRLQGCDLVLGWCMDSSPNYRVYRRNFFLTFPERLRPIKLHFGARAFDPQIESRIYDRKSWYLSYLDSDTV